MFKQFLRTKTCIFGLSIVLILGLVSILVGKQFLTRQEKAIDEVIEKQAAHIERNLDHHSDDIGLLLYYLKFSLVNKATPLAALSIGQSDVHPKVQRVKILTLEGQKYDSDLVNPVKLLYGNLDLGFLIVNVFPLLIIAFTYNLRSEEVESGTWRFVQVMSRSRFRFLFAKLSVRAVLLFSALILLFMLASLILGIPWNEPFFAFLLTAVFYLIFWFVLSYGVVSLGRNSNFNALTLLALWLCLVILLPAALNNFVNTRHPIPEAFSSMIKQRNGYHQKWDTNKRKTLEAFYARYPQFE
ncbi:MAG: ABC transporter permease subunit, partial [Bacteroidota bacterium]